VSTESLHSEEMLLTRWRHRRNRCLAFLEPRLGRNVAANGHFRQPAVWACLYACFCTPRTRAQKRARWG